MLHVVTNSYPAADVLRILGGLLGPQQLKRWTDIGLVRPDIRAAGRGHQHGYSAANIFALAIAATMHRQQFSGFQIESVLRFLSETDRATLTRKPILWIQMTASPEQLPAGATLDPMRTELITEGDIVKRVKKYGASTAIPLDDLLRLVEGNTGEKL